MAFYHCHHSSLTLRARDFQVYTISSSLQGIKFFSRSYVWQIVSSLALWVLWNVRCSKLYNDENTHVVDQLSLFGIYWFIRLKVIMTSIRVLETQLIEKEGEFDEFGHQFLSC